MTPTSAVSVAFDPLLGWPLLAVLGGIGLVLVLLGLRAGARGTIWRLGSVLVVLAALANPALIEEQRKPIADVALVVVDDSDSMAIGERRPQVQAAREALKKKLGQQEGLEVREAVLPPAHIQLGSDRPGGTRLIEAMRSALVEVPPERLAGVILLTDGQVHDVPTTLPPELGGAPLHALIAGKKGERDRLIVLEQSPRFGVVGRQVTAKFRVEDPAGGTAPVTLSVGGEIVRRLDVPVGHSVELPITVGNPGANVVELEVAPGPSELTLDNNRALFTINGVRDRLRVLLISGEPYQGERAWRNLLKSDPAVDLVHFTILRTPQKDDFTPVRELSLIVFPQRELFEQKLKEFDLIIFDRYESGNLITRDYFRNIAEYVKGGGALLVSVGPVFATQRSLYRTPLGAILPAAPLGDVLETGFKPKVTEIGQRHPVTANLPQAGDPGKEPEWGRWFRLVTSRTEHGNAVLSGAEDKPAGGSRPRRPGPRGGADVRPAVAVEPRHRRRRPAARTGAPRRALADEGARPRGGGAARHRGRRPHRGDAPHACDQLPAGHHDRAGHAADRRRHQHARAAPDRARASARRSSMSTSPASTASTTARCAPWRRSAVPIRWNSPTCARPIRSSSRWSRRPTARCCGSPTSPIPTSARCGPAAPPAARTG